MAKELPYFKFEPNRWDNGNIQILSREDKGLFVDICSMYWSRLGHVPKKLVIQRLCGGNANALDSLCNEKIIDIIDDNIYIKFLSEQLSEFEDKSEVNSKNAKEGWEKRRRMKEESDRNATASYPQSENDGIRGEKRRGEERREENNVYRKFLHLSIMQKEVDTLLKDYSIEEINTVLDLIENFKGNKKYTSLFLTAKNWLKRDLKNKNNDTPKIDRFNHNLSVMERTLIEINEYDNEANR